MLTRPRKGECPLDTHPVPAAGEGPAIGQPFRPLSATEAPPTAAEVAPAPPASEPKPEAPAPAAKTAEPAALSVSQYVVCLVVGLLPLLGLIVCLVWAYGGGHSVARRNLAKALLCLHAVFLCLCILALCIWVFHLAGRLSALSSQALLLYAFAPGG